jgi:hypothetical protein
VSRGAAAFRKYDLVVARDSYELGPGFSWTNHVRGRGRLAYEDGGKVVVRDFPSDERREIDSEAAWRSACPLAWSPDGRTLFQSFRGQVDAIDVGTGARRTLTAFREDPEQSGVHWQLHCSPDGKRLLFLHSQPIEGKCTSRICSATTEGSEVREVCAMGSLWNFACSWDHDVLLVSVAGPQPSLWRMDLDGGGPSCVLDGSLVSELQVAPDGEHAIYHLQSGVFSLELKTGKASRIVEHGKVPALSPEGRTLAFQRGEHDLYVQPIGGKAELVLAARENDETWRPFGWQTKPLWSPDGRLLLCWTTIGKRHAEPLDPDFVTMMRKEEAAAERRRGKGEKGSQDHAYDVAIESAHWSFEHSVAVIDFETRVVWMEDGRWSDASWA